MRTIIHRAGRPPLSLLSLAPVLAVLMGAVAISAEWSVPDESPAVLKALSTLDGKEYGEELTWWAADERGGREPGTPGSIAAGDQAAREFLRLGLKSVGDVIDGEPSYFQYFERGGKKGLFPGHRLAVAGKEFQLGIRQPHVQSTAKNGDRCGCGTPISHDSFHFAGRLQVCGVGQPV